MMGGTIDLAWREALYRQMARTPGLPPGLRPEMIKRAERCSSQGGDVAEASDAGEGDALGL